MFAPVFYCVFSSLVTQKKAIFTTSLKLLVYKPGRRKQQSHFSYRKKENLLGLGFLKSPQCSTAFQVQNILV